MRQTAVNIKNRATEISEKIMTWLGFAKDVNGEWKFSNLTFGSIIGILVGSGGILWAGTKIFDLIKKIKGIGGLFGGILGSSNATGNVGSGLSVPNPKNVLKGLADLAIIIGGLEALILAIGLLRKIPGFDEVSKSGLEQIVELFTKLGKVALPIGAFSAIIVGLGFASPMTIISGLAGFALIIAGLEAVLAALGGLRQIPGFDWIISEGGQALVQLGDILGRFAGSIVGGLVGGVVEGVMSTLPKLGTYLSQFSTNATPFFKTVKTIKSDSLLGVKYTAEAIIVLTAANLLNGLSKWLGFGKTNLADFGKELANFAPYFAKYATTIKKANIDSKLVKESAEAAESLAQMANKLPRQEGWVQKVFGTKKKLSDFGKELALFGPYFASYANSVKNISSDTVIASANAAKSLTELVNNLPKQGGLWQSLVGSKDLSKFGETLKSFGISFRDYANSVANISTNKVNSINKSISELVDASVKIKDKGVTNTLKDFAKNLKTSSDSFNNFFSKTNGNSIGKDFGNALAKAISTALKSYKYPTISLQNTLGTAISSFKIKAYADGGFPDIGDLFIANEKKPEWVGSMNGRPAVANNEEITSGIEQASFQGMMKALNATGGRNQKVEITAEGDASGLLDFITFKQKQANRRNGL